MALTGEDLSRSSRRVLLVSDCRERLRRSLLYTPRPPPTSQQQWRQLTTWHCPHLLLRAVLRFGAATAERRRVIDRYLLLGSKPAAAECGGRMGQTDGRTPYRYIDPLSLPSRHTLLERSCVHNRMPVFPVIPPKRNHGVCDVPTHNLSGRF